MMPPNLLSPRLIEQSELLRNEFLSNQPFRHVVIDQFLDPAFCRALLSEFPGFDARHAVNELGEAGRKAVVSALAEISPTYGRLDELLRSRDFLNLVGRITGIDRLLYDPDYIGGGTHENLDGQDLDPHIDFNYHPTRQWRRRLNLIVFLNPAWEAGWGGCLELLQDPWSPLAEQTRTVVPLLNRAVIFETTESSWHGFRRIQLPEQQRGLSRRSVAVYFYTRERPPAETGASHGTVYIPRPLPERLRPDHTLTAGDMHELEILIARRDAQIRFLYERELEFSQALENISRSPSFRAGRVLTWPFRKLRSILTRI